MKIKQAARFEENLKHDHADTVMVSGRAPVSEVALLKERGYNLSAIIRKAISDAARLESSQNKLKK